MPRSRRNASTWAALNPRATEGDYSHARATAKEVAREEMRAGARAVVLAGSWARGDAHRCSDIDLWVIGPRRGSKVLLRNGFLVCLSRTTATAERRSLNEPRRIGGVVPGWRHAIPLYDPRAIARRLKAEAEQFRWERIGPKCDRWVAESLVGWAEEAIKLVRALAEGRLRMASVQRNLLVDSLGFVMATHRRQFWDSENEFWERVGASIGGRWGAAQRASLGGDDLDLAASCAAALDLYAETARVTRSLLNPRQESVVLHACRAIGHPLP